MTPKISVITVNLNNAEGLSKTIESVVNQTFTNFNHIIIDGGSKDESLNIIETYRNKNTNLHSISEPDKGIYNAMNKGIRLATSEYLIFMNSGDTFYANDVLQRVANQINGSDFLYGNAFIVDHNNSWIEVFPSKLTLGFMANKFLCHQAIFYKREIFNKIGFYNENYKVYADWDINVRAIFFENVTYSHLDMPICIFDRTGVSSNSAYIKEELIQVKQSLMPINIWNELEKSYQNERKLMLLRQSRLISLISKFSNKIQKTLS